MLDIGSWEFLLIIMLGIVVIGPKELPGVVRSVGLWVRRAKDLAREFQGGLEEIARETEIDKVKNNLETELGDANLIVRKIGDAVEPDGELTHEFDFEEGEFYSDPQDVEDEITEAPPVTEELADVVETAAADSSSETTPNEPLDTDAKTGN